MLNYLFRMSDLPLDCAIRCIWNRLLSKRIVRHSDEDQVDSFFTNVLISVYVSLKPSELGDETVIAETFINRSHFLRRSPFIKQIWNIRRVDTLVSDDPACTETDPVHTFGIHLCITGKATDDVVEVKLTCPRRPQDMFGGALWEEVLAKDRVLAVRSSSSSEVSPFVGRTDMCNACGQRATAEIKLRFCGACRCAYYCSTSCQRADWRIHKTMCCSISFTQPPA